MKRIFQVLVITFLIPTLVQAADLKRFLKTCAWGTVFGAGAGVVSLAFSDQPSEHWNNVAKGASLGLYAGIAYGVYEINQPTPQYDQHPDFSMAPQFHEGKVDGIQLTGMLYSF
jgi:hypothetical protein